MGDFMFNDNEPLMYINSITKTSGENGQSVFDSRKQTVYKEKEEKIKVIYTKELQKIENMIKLYNNNKVVVCKIFLEDEEIECVPVKIENNNLYIKRTDSSINNISMENIRKVEIIHI